MPLLDLQRRLMEIGRLRAGIRDGRNPKKLATWRATSMSKDAIESVASVYGGTVNPWKADPKGAQQWEVITETDALDIVVAPGQVLSQAWELWTNGGCQRRCDGFNEVFSDGPCLCPADFQERRVLAQNGQACKPTSRFSCLLRDVQTIGLWRAESHGVNAAMELGGMADILEHATKRGLFIPARLRLDQRTAKKNVDGKPMTHRFAVPVVEIAASFRQVQEALGMDGGIAAAPQSLQSGAAPVPVPALPRGGEGVAESAVSSGAATRPSLPAAPRGRAKREPLTTDRPGLPADPSFHPNSFADEPVDAEVVPDAPKPILSMVPPLGSEAEVFDRLSVEPKRTDRGPQIAMSAKAAGLDDEIRHDLIGWVTAGRTRSGSDCSDAEAGELYKLFSEVKRGRKQLSYDPGGKLVVT